MYEERPPHLLYTFSLGARSMILPFLVLRYLVMVGLLPTIVVSFVSQSSRGWINKSLSNHHDGTTTAAKPRPSSSSSSTCLSSLSPSAEAVSEHIHQRNMFHDYDKPIMLVGRSSAGNELERLAASFVKDNFPNQGGIVLPLQQESTQGILDEIQNSKLGWPSVIVVDLSKGGEDVLSSTAKSLYDLGLLSVYVNVAETEANSGDDEELLVTVSDFELCIQDEGIQGGADWDHIQWELSRLIARARLAPAVPGEQTPSTNTAHLTMGDHTFFLSLSFPEISQVEPYVKDMCMDVDAMEYRTDLLDCRDSRFDLIYGMQLLRRYCRNHVVRVPALPFFGQVLEDVMPIVYTVRTRNQAGTYPDDEEGIAKMFDLLAWGLRGGVEVLDVESAWDPQRTDALLSRAETRYSSQILGSHHVVGEEVSSEEAVRLFQQCALNGRAHGAKVVLSIKDAKKDRMAHEAALLASTLAEKAGKPVIPNVSLILGDIGKFSRVVNFPFTPVTHEALPFKAAPGQMSASEIMASRILMKMLPGRRYAILGHNIAYSVSPQMQGAAFRATQLPHQYGRADVEDVKEFVESNFFQDPLFGGCSVTIPHKQAIIPYVDVMSDAAQIIGSVNTLIAQHEIHGDEIKRIIYGDNTDWRGIFNPLERQMGVRGRGDGSDESTAAYALILGGGGTARAAAYAAQKLGLQRIYYNRTPSKAADLAESFGGTVIGSLDRTGEDSLGALLERDGTSVEHVPVIISTLPASAEFVLPDWILQSTKPVIFDVNYKPYHTNLLDQAEAAGCSVVRGSEMLWEQGVGQFELWTGRTAPYAVMKAVVLQNCIPEGEFL